MKNISFSLTTPQFKNRSKTVTRRRGWENAKPGQILMGCKKCQGIPAGEEIERLGPIILVDVRREPLNAITDDDVAAEGFPHNCRRGFITMFVGAMGGHVDQPVTRLEFRYIPGFKNGGHDDREHID